MSGIGEVVTVVRRRLPASRLGTPPLATGVLVVRLALATLFIWAGALKLSHPRAFAHVVDEYGLVPAGWPLVMAAFAVPSLELLAGIGVLLDRSAGYWLMLGMLGVFIGVLWFGILNDLDVDCGCFSLEEQRGQVGLRTAFVRDWLMAAAAGSCLLARGRLRRTRNQPRSTTREEET